MKKVSYQKNGAVPETTQLDPALQVNPLAKVKGILESLPAQNTSEIDTFELTSALEDMPKNVLHEIEGYLKSLKTPQQKATVLGYINVILAIRAARLTPRAQYELIETYFKRQAELANKQARKSAPILPARVAGLLLTAGLAGAMLAGCTPENQTQASTNTPIQTTESTRTSETQNGSTAQATPTQTESEDPEPQPSSTPVLAELFTEGYILNEVPYEFDPDTGVFTAEPIPTSTPEATATTIPTPTPEPTATQEIEQLIIPPEVIQIADNLGVEIASIGQITQPEGEFDAFYDNDGHMIAAWNEWSKSYEVTIYKLDTYFGPLTYEITPNQKNDILRTDEEINELISENPERMRLNIISEPYSYETDRNKIISVDSINMEGIAITSWSQDSVKITNEDTGSIEEFTFLRTRIATIDETGKLIQADLVFRGFVDWDGLDVIPAEQLTTERMEKTQRISLTAYSPSSDLYDHTRYIAENRFYSKSYLMAMHAISYGNVEDLKEEILNGTLIGGIGSPINPGRISPFLIQN